MSTESNNHNTPSNIKEPSKSHLNQTANNLSPLFNRTGTVVLTLLAVLGFFGFQVINLLLGLLITLKIMPHKFKETDIQYILTFLDSDGTVLSISVVLNLLAIILFVFFILKIRKKSFTDYLHFRPFSLKITLMSFGLWIVYLIASATLFHLTNHQPMDFLDVYFQSANPRWLLFLGIILLAPIYEELIFRGLIWRAIAEQFVSDRRGAIIASIISGVLFASIHLQYDFYELGTIFVLALVLGFARYRSGSILLPIAIHIANNALSMTQYLWVME